jgi:hypothetical protein
MISRLINIKPINSGHKTRLSKKISIQLLGFQLIPRFQHKAAGAVLGELANFLFLQNPEGFAGEIHEINIFRV